MANSRSTRIDRAKRQRGPGDCHICLAGRPFAARTAKKDFRVEKSIAQVTNAFEFLVARTFNWSPGPLGKADVASINKSKLN